MKSPGFTLIELLLVITLITLLFTMGTSFTARFLTQNAVSNASDQIVGDFRKAQINAMMGKQGGNWGVNYSSNTITLYQGNSYAARNSAFDETFSVNQSVTISGLGDNNLSRITGLPNGFTTPETITISGSGETKTITVNSQGVVTR